MGCWVSKQFSTHLAAWLRDSGNTAGGLLSMKYYTKRILRPIVAILAIMALSAGCAVSVDHDYLYIEHTIKNRRIVDSLVAERLKND